MQYVVVHYFGDGAMKRNEYTLEPEVTSIGEFDSPDEAIKQACKQLNCNHLCHGLLSFGEGLGGYLVMDTQELVTI